MPKKYELTIIELTPFTEEEIKVQESQEKERRYNGNKGYDEGRTMPVHPIYSDRPHHHTRVLQVELNEEEYKTVKSEVIKAR